VRCFDVFNGDADGICALHQLRLAEPLDAELVTGLKHDIALLDRVDAAAGDRVTVLDVSLDRNRARLMALLARGATVRYFDHHHAGAIPEHPGLEATIDATGLLCTGELVDRHLGGRFRAWAVVAAFGDNLPAAAVRLAATLGYDAGRVERLRELGESLNYNAYGASEADVAIAPAALYRLVRPHADPFTLLECEPSVAHLARARRADLEQAAQVRPWRASPAIEIRLLPDAAWSRRARGAVANRAALEHPHRAHAVLAPLPGGGFAVSVRSPRGRGPSAADFCRRFPGGGGRATAAGIERLDAAGLDAFAEAFIEAYAHARGTSERLVGV
jgi:hypothetical protein